MAKQRVLLLGATGQTGGSILEALLAEDKKFEVEALVRPSSAEKPEVKKVTERGVKINIADVTGPADNLVKLLTGFDVVISAVDAASQLAQFNLATAAKKAGVKRFVPCAFTTVAPPGDVMMLRDHKEQIYQHVRKLYLPYTVIDVGYWHQLSFPTVPSGRADYAAWIKPNVAIHAGGEAPNLLTDLRDIGPFVARIIADERTLNHSVFTYSDVLTENQVFAMMEEVSGEKIEREHVSAEEVEADVEESKKAYAAQPESPMALLMVVKNQYVHSKYVRGDNSPEHAKYLGYLDARELYPDFEPTSFRDFLLELLDGKVVRPYPNMDMGSLTERRARQG